MGKIFKIVLGLGLLILGMLISRPNGDNINYYLDQQIADFENQISNPDNEFVSPTLTKIVPGIPNKIGNKLESVIDSSSNYLTNLLKKLLGTSADEK